MYAIHTTRGFIVGSRPSGEAGKLLSIFTKDLGLIRATAQGIRFEKSKLRPFIQDYSLGIFSFVRGKEFWRLTSANESEKLKGETEKVEGRQKERKETQELIARIALLLGRLLQGEEPHPELFTTLDSVFEFLESKQDKEIYKTLESLIVIRILHRLGYIASVPELREYIESDDLSTESLAALETLRVSMNQHINKALRESHL